jgi:hypothetical protein
MLYIIFGLKFDIFLKNYVKNAFLGKDFNLDATGSLFQAFTQMVYNNMRNMPCERRWYMATNFGIIYLSLK